jgi:hypothetical protein
MRLANMQLSEIKKLEWEELVWLHDEINAQLMPATTPAPKRKAIGEAVEDDDGR